MTLTNLEFYSIQSQFAVVHLVHFMLWITPLDPFFKSGFITLQTLKVLARDILNPTCVIYESGVIFVAEEHSLSYLDVSNVVKLNPKALKKPRLQEELRKRGLLGQDERVSVAEMR